MKLSTSVAFLLLISGAVGAQQTETPLPRKGDLADILTCAGTNEVLWTTAIKADPHDRRAHEAKRKAGWYAAVALWIFEADSAAVTQAIRVASEHQPRVEVFNTALKCRPAPSSWRE